MKFKFAATFILLLVFNICTAQTVMHTKNNALSLELGKSGLIYNLTFDHKFQDKNIGLRVIAGSNFAKWLKAIKAGAGVYYLINSLELGLDLEYLSIEERSDDQRGVVFLYPNYPIQTFYASANIGYRKYGKNTLFRVGVSPGIIEDRFLPGGYISFGFRF